MKKNLVLLVLLLSGLGALPAFGQKPAGDPRPLHGLRNDEIPRYRTVEEYRLTHPSGSLQQRLVFKGIAPRVPFSSAGTMPVGPFDRLAAPLVSPLRIERASNGAVRWIDGALGRMMLPTAIAGQDAKALVAQGAISVIDRYKPLLRIADPAGELELMTDKRDEIGSRHIRFQQVYKGLPVWGRDLYLHIDARDEAYALNGSTIPTPVDLSIVPSLGGDAALDRVIADLTAKGRWAPLTDDVAEWLDIDGPQTTLVIYPEGEGPNGAPRSLRLAYEVTLHPNLLEWFTYLIDARTGAILNRIARHCSLREHGHDPKRPADKFTRAPQTLTESPLQSNGAGQFVDATGRDLANANRSFRVYQHTDNFFYSLWDLSNFTLANSTLPNTLAGGAMALTADGKDLDQSVQLKHVSNNANNWSDRSAVSAIMNQKSAFDYFSRTFSRKAIDDKDQSMMSILHVTEGGQPMDNAFWNGRMMAYGDGAQSFTPLAGGEDVAGHEMAHGVVQNTADLIYQNQSGALNESFADVFGIMIDRDDFLLGEDIMKPGQGIALRDIENPNNPQVLARQPAHMNQFQNLTPDQDNGGVHVNSGIPNRAAFNLIQAIGREKTERIYYRALSNYLVRDSKFIDARNAVERAAKDLFGASGSEAAAVRAAFDAVGILGGNGSDPNEDDVPPQNGGSSFIAFTTADGTIGVLDPTTGQGAVFNSPDAKARVLVNGDGSTDRAQLSTPTAGGQIWFVNQQRQLSAVNVATGAVSIIPGHIQAPGDFWNAVISPDEKYAAIVSAYQNDATMYFFDGEDLGQIALTPETTQEGVDSETIKYPDVISWSPNLRDPRIAFDAYNEVNIAGGGQAAFWSMYEIDFDATSDDVNIYGLIPAQSFDISVGNVAYSKLDPDLIAFNVIDENGAFDVYLANFETGETVGLGLNELTQPILDGERPTFAPDNSELAFVSASNNALLFLNLGNGQFRALTFQAPIFNPYWFLLGGVTGVRTGTDAATAGMALRSLPNPAQGSTMIEFVLPEAGDATLQVIDLYGRPVATLLDGRLPAGPGSKRFDTGALAAGTYLLRLSAAGRVETGRLVIIR